MSTDQDPSSANPYASPLDVSTVLDDDEAIRQQYLSHETSVRSIGILYFVGAVFLIVMAVIMLAAAIASLGSSRGAENAMMGAIAVVYLVLGGLQLWTGMGLRKLKSWAKIVAVIFSVIGLIGIPIGTLISGYFLYLLLGAKGKFVFSEEYRGVIDRTPHIKYKTPLVIWILLGLLVLILVLGFATIGVGLLFSSPNNF